RHSYIVSLFPCTTLFRNRVIHWGTTKHAYLCSWRHVRYASSLSFCTASLIRLYCLDCKISRDERAVLAVETARRCRKNVFKLLCTSKFTCFHPFLQMGLRTW